MRYLAMAAVMALVFALFSESTMAHARCAGRRLQITRGLPEI